MSAAEKSLRAAETMKEFRDCIIRFLNARQEIQELGAYVRRETGMMHYNHNGVEAKKERLIPEYAEARREVAARLQEASGICHIYGMPYQLTIRPPPAFGGYSHSMNAFQAVIEDELPNGFELNPQKVIDLIDQTIYACGHSAQHAIENPPSKLKGVDGAFKSVYNFLFRTDAQKSALGWAVIAVMVAGALRLFGFNLTDTVKMLFDLWKGK